MAGTFSYHVNRSDMTNFQWDTCRICSESIITAHVKMQHRSFDPKPTGGTEMNPVYSTHVCPRKDD